MFKNTKDKSYFYFKLIKKTYLIKYFEPIKKGYFVNYYF